MLSVGKYCSGKIAPMGMSGKRTGVWTSGKLTEDQIFLEVKKPPSWKAKEALKAVGLERWNPEEDESSVRR